MSFHVCDSQNSVLKVQGQGGWIRLWWKISFYFLQIIQLFG